MLGIRENPTPLNSNCRYSAHPQAVVSPIVLNRNLIVLLLAQMVFVSASALNVTLGGIVGSELAPTAALSTLPVSLTILGTALGTVPATLLMQRIGRRRGFMMAALMGVAASLVSRAGVTSNSFMLFCTGTALTGVCLAFGQQFRFAAAESVVLAKAGKAISIVLLGSIGGAIVGPELMASGTVLDTSNPVTGALWGAAGLFLIGALLLAGYRDAPIKDTTKSADNPADSPISSLFREPLFLLAVAGGVIGQGIMAFIMTATPVSMHVMDGHSLPHTAAVIRAHVLAMYIPSLASGWLISRFGERPLMLAGLCIYGATLLVGLAGQEVMHYTGSMVLLGVGWNFLFVGGTTLLVRTYPEHLRFRAQSINEAAVFGTSALGSLLAGTVLSAIGWQAVLLATLPAIFAMTAAVSLLLRRPLPVFNKNEQ